MQATVNNVAESQDINESNKTWLKSTLAHSIVTHLLRSAYRGLAF
jgi:hypothetical protein